VVGVLAVSVSVPNSAHACMHSARARGPPGRCFDRRRCMRVRQSGWMVCSSGDVAGPTHRSRGLNFWCQRLAHGLKALATLSCSRQTANGEGLEAHRRESGWKARPSFNRRMMHSVRSVRWLTSAKCLLAARKWRARAPMTCNALPAGASSLLGGGDDDEKSAPPL
jgi:hypothetical protein